MPRTIRGPGAFSRATPEGEAVAATDTIRDRGRTPSPRSLEPGDLVGVVLKEKYQLVKVLAAGAMGTVYEALHLGLQRRFAVKVLSIDSRQQADALPRFKREAELASAIGHKHIVDTVDIDRTDDDQWYIVMELLEGEELRDLMFREKRLPLEVVVSIARQLCSAMDAAHAQGIVHRDLKPENIFVLDRKDDEGMPIVKIVDFGISKVRNAETTLTQPGEVIGTPYYMAPEQARGDRTIDHRADLFALGAVFYEALTGTAPFQGSTPNAVLRAILLDDLPSPGERNPELPGAVCEVLEKALSKDADDRYQSGAELANALAAAAGIKASAIPEPVPPPEPEPTTDRVEREAPPKAAPAPAAAGFRTIHLVLAFAAGAIVCAAIVALVLLSR